jgi:antigen flippase
MSDHVAQPPARPDSYREILHSTALIGASSLVSMVFSLIRMKGLALLLGPAGVGLIALFNAIADVTVAVAGLGVSQSGVRQIAQAMGEGDHGRIAATMAVLGRTSLILGLAGGLGLAVLAVPAALLTFGSAQYSVAVAALGLLVLLRILTGGQTALLQGARRVGDLAWLNIIAAVVGLVITLPLVYLWREQAVVPALILVALGTWVVARWFVGKVAVNRRPVPAVVRWSDVEALLRLGTAFMVSGVLTMGAAYAVRILVLHETGVDAAGLYQSAWAVSGLYAGVVLQAMGTDFYPRLTAAAADDALIGRLVNEQTEVSLLLAGPGVLATMSLAHLALLGFYSQEFIAAAELLRWLSLGMMLRVVSWPLGFIIVAKGWQKAFVAIEVGATALHVGLAALLLPHFGINATGMAFTGLYACHGVVVYLIARQRCGFQFSPENRILLILFGAATLLVFVSFFFLSFWWATVVGLVATGMAGIGSLIALSRLAADPIDKLKARVGTIGRWFTLRSRRGASL